MARLGVPDANRDAYLVGAPSSSDAGDVMDAREARRARHGWTVGKPRDGAET